MFNRKQTASTVKVEDERVNTANITHVKSLRQFQKPRSFLYCFIFGSIIAIVFFTGTKIESLNFYSFLSSTSGSTYDILDTPFQRPRQCNREELLKVRYQLPPEQCISSERSPWRQKCSFTAATKCPKAVWLDDYYLYLQRRLVANSSQHKEHSASFVGISIGCNKGFDAINTLRMGTFNHAINKASWKTAMETHSGALHDSVCQQNNPESISPLISEFEKDYSKVSAIRPHGEMHCIEPMPKTYESLSASAKDLGYDKFGLYVTHGAVSKKSGEMYFPTNTGAKSGVENLGLSTCEKLSAKDRQEVCDTVHVYTLKDFYDQKVINKDVPINILTVDVEGFDGDVLLGASERVLKRTEYLEFEYNWMGSWAGQHLYDLVTMLDETADFTCYWAGIERLWRITDCWMAYFDLRHWSNVACVNRSLVPYLADKMESIFQQTLNDEKRWNPDENVAISLKDHNLMSTDDTFMTQKYAA